MKNIVASTAMRKPEDETGSDADTAETVTTATKRERKQVSKRSFLFDGKEVDKIEEANAARYTLLVPSGNVDLDSPVFGEPGKLATMCAIFGFHTKVGNVANTVLNDKDDAGTPEDAAAEIKEFLAKAESGTWAERTSGGVGARIDKDALASAIVAVALAGGAITAAQEGDTYAKVRDRLEKEPAYVRGARGVPDVAREYATRVGKATKTVADLL